MRTGTSFILAFLMLTAAGKSQVRPRPGAAPPPPSYLQQLKSFDQEGAITKVVLKNDLTVLVAEAHATPLVDVLTWVKVGYRDDPPDSSGISCILEHMLFRGTAGRTAANTDADIKTMGGEFGSSTSYDHTWFRITAPSLQWKRAVEIQADSLLNPLLDAAELKRQIGLLVEARRSELADPETLGENRLLETGFAGRQMGRRGPLPANALNSITREKLLAFYRSAYIPSRVLVIVCGDVTATDVLGTAVDLYSKAKSASAVELHAPEQDFASGFQYVQVRGSNKPAHLLLGFRTAPSTSPDYPALEVLRAMLGTGEGAILSRRLKYQKDLISSSDIKLVGYPDAGYLILSLELEPKELDRCEIAAFTEFEILKREPPGDADLRRAQAQVVREYWEAAQTVSARADRIAHFESSGSWKALNGYLARIGQVKRADIPRVASRYLNLDNCALLEYLPADAEARTLSAEGVQNTIRDLLAPAAEQEMTERQKATELALEIPENAGTFSPTEVRHSFREASILRGPSLFIKEDHTSPLIHMGFFYAGGRLAESKANAGITTLMLHTMLRDSKTKDADRIYRQLELYGGIIDPVIAADYFGLRMSIPSAFVEKGLDLLSEMIKSPKFDPQEIQRQKGLQSVELMRRTNRKLADTRLRSALFNDHPYALESDGSDQSLAAITPEAITAWYSTTVQNKKPMVVIIGDTEGTALAAYFVRNYSGSRFEDIKLPQGFPKALESQSSIEAGWNGDTSLIVVGFQAPPAGDDDSFPLIVLESYASGLAGRLTDRLMDRLPDAFQASMNYEPRLRGGNISVFVRVTPTGEEQASKLLTEEIQRLTTATIPYRDYRSAVNSAVGSTMIGEQICFRQIDDLIMSILAGNGIDGFTNTINRLQGVSQTDLQEVAQRFLKIQKSVVLRLHGKSAP